MFARHFSRSYISERAIRDASQQFGFLMRTLVVIPARLGATRLAEKPLRLLGGLPLIVRVWQRISEMGFADDCVVAVDDERVASVVRDAGGNAVMTSSRHSTGTERVAEVAANPRFAAYGAFLNVQGDEPFIEEEAVHAASEVVTGGAFPLGTAASAATPEILDLPTVVKVVIADDRRALYFSRAPIPFLRDSADAGVRDSRVLQHIGVYAYTRDALAAWVKLPPHPLEEIERLEQLRPLAAGIPIGVAVTAAKGTPATGIDTEADLIRANERWETMLSSAAT